MASVNCCKTLSNGYKMPLIGLGTSGGHDDTMRKAVRCALEKGYRSIDTAYLYMNEEAIGNELQEWFQSGKLRREDVFVTSKLPAIGNRPEDVGKFLTKSLNKLKLQYLDMYLIHHPFGLRTSNDSDVFPKDEQGKSVLDHDTDLEALWRALEKEVEAGRVKSLGVSNFNVSQIERIMKIAKHPPTVNQVEVHGYLQQRPLMAKCRELDIAIVGYSPLGAPHTDDGKVVSPPLLENAVVEEIAKRQGKSCAQVLLKFLLQRDIIIIPKSVTPARIASNFEVTDFTLTKEDMDAIEKLDRGEEGRVYHFRSAFVGCTEHKEYPFHAEF